VKSHRERRRWRRAHHLGRASRMRADTLQRQEIARLRALYLETGERAILGQVGILEDELDRSRPMPTRFPS
jgi:hypothetical protein